MAKTDKKFKNMFFWLDFFFFWFSAFLVKIIYLNLFYYLVYFCYYLWILLYF